MKAECCRLCWWRKRIKLCERTRENKKILWWANNSLKRKMKQGWTYKFWFRSQERTTRTNKDTSESSKVAIKQLTKQWLGQAIRSKTKDEKRKQPLLSYNKAKGHFRFQRNELKKNIRALRIKTKPSCVICIKQPRKRTPHLTSQTRNWWHKSFEKRDNQTKCVLFWSNTTKNIHRGKQNW